LVRRGHAVEIEISTDLLIGFSFRAVYLIMIILELSLSPCHAFFFFHREVSIRSVNGENWQNNTPNHRRALSGECRQKGGIMSAKRIFDRLMLQG
jgi:hypothetical protein